MKRYSGTWGARIECLFFIGVASGIIYFGVAIAMTRSAESILGSVAFFILAGVLMTIAVYGLLESSTVISTDSEQITRKSWNGSVSMRWNKVSAYIKNGMQDATVTLKDDDSQKLTFNSALLPSKERIELLSEIDRRLSGLRDQIRQDLNGSVKDYYPTRTLAYACGGLLAMFLLAGTALCIRPVPDDQRGALYGLVATILGMSLLFAVFIVALFTERITISGYGITQLSWFHRRTIPFDHVKSMDTKEQWFKGRLWKRTTIEGDGKKVEITSQMEDYPIVCDFIRSRIRT